MAFLVIVPQSLRALADAAAEQHFDNPNPCFVDGLSADGQPPATHAWLSCEFRPEKAALLQQMLAQPEWAGVIAVEWDPGTQSADGVAAAHGLVRVTPQNEP